jgi:hypothetical protein
MFKKIVIVLCNIGLCVGICAAQTNQPTPSKPTDVPSTQPSMVQPSQSHVASDTSGPGPKIARPKTPEQPTYDAIVPKDGSDGKVKYVIVQFKYVTDEKQLELNKQDQAVNQKYDPVLSSLQIQLQTEFEKMAQENNWDPKKIRFNDQTNNFEVKHGDSPFLTPADTAPIPVPSKEKLKSKK